MRYYGLGKSEIQSMNIVEMSGWVSMIPATRELLGEEKEQLAESPNPSNLFMP